MDSNPNKNHKMQWSKAVVECGFIFEQLIYPADILKEIIICKKERIGWRWFPVCRMCWNTVGKVNATAKQSRILISSLAARRPLARLIKAQPCATAWSQVITNLSPFYEVVEPQTYSTPSTSQFPHTATETIPYKFIPSQRQTKMYLGRSSKGQMSSSEQGRGI